MLRNRSMNMRAQHQVSCFEESVVDGVVVHLKENSLDLQFVLTVFHNVVHKGLDIMLGIIEEVELRKLIWFVLQGFLGSCVQRVVFVVHVLQLN